MAESQVKNLSNCGLKVILGQLFGKIQTPGSEPFAIQVLASRIMTQFPDVNVSLHSVTEDDMGIELFLQEAQYSDFIGLSIPQGTIDISFKILEFFDSLKTRPLIVLGNALPSYEYEYFIKRFPWVYIIRGWGEDAIVEMLTELRNNKVHPNFDKVSNLVYLRDNTIVTNPIKWPKTYTDTSSLKTDEYLARVEASRGCHYNRCTFCTRPPGPRLWVKFPADEVVKSIIKMKEKGIKYFSFADEEFVGNDIVHALEISEKLLTVKGINFSLSVRPDNVINSKDTPELREMRRSVFANLKRAGLKMVFLGVESLSDTQLKRYRKGFSSAEALNAISELRSLGISFEMGFILFDPFTTMKEVIDNYTVLKKTGYWRYVGQIFNHLRIQKDSLIYHEMKNSGLLKEYDLNTMQYEYISQNSDVERLKRACLFWKNFIDRVYLLERNRVRNELGFGMNDKYVLSLRKLSFQFLEALLQTSNERELIVKISHLHNLQRNVIQNLKEYLEKKDPRIGDTKELLIAINKYLEKQNFIYDFKNYILNDGNRKFPD